MENEKQCTFYKIRKVNAIKGLSGKSDDTHSQIHCHCSDDMHFICKENTFT